MLCKKMIDGIQMKVVCNVDALKVSHVYSFEITNISGHLSKIYGGLRAH